MIHISAPAAGVALFIILTGILFLLVRQGVFGLNIRGRGQALAVSALFGLGTSLIITCLLAGTASAGTWCALVYMGAGTPVAAYIWKSGMMTRKIVSMAAVMGTLCGFVFLAPIMPMELGGIINVLTGVSVLNAGIVVIITVVILAIVLGRVFCGNICPVGSLQELAYDLQVRKIRIRRTEWLELFRLVVFAVTALAAAYLIDLMALTGLYDLFSLSLSLGFVVAAGLVLISAFLYRPICRVLCPFGVLFSVFAEFSLFRLRRTENCISCRKCETACPARTSGPGDSKRECYLCGRCTGTCPVKSALAYQR